MDDYFDFDNDGKLDIFEKASRDEFYLKIRSQKLKQ